MLDTQVSATVFIVDDQADITDMMEDLLSSVSIPVKAFQSGLAFLEYIQDHPDGAYGCLIVDMLMPRMNGIEVLTELKERDIGIPTIMMSGHGDVASAVQAMRLGAINFIQKPFGPQLLLNSVQEALRLSEEIRARDLRQQELLARVQKLTAREKEVFKLLSQGRDTKEIAAQLHISTNTVDSHRSHISRKMHAEGLSQLIVMGIQVAKSLSNQKDER